jgi:hypothetical protein
VRLLGMLLVALSAATAGCSGRGLLYTQVVSPYLTEYHDTPVGSKSCRVREHTLREPVTGYNLSVAFSLPVLQRAARQAGLTQLYYVDEETLSVLLGIYERKTLILYGD